MKTSHRFWLGVGILLFGWLTWYAWTPFDVSFETGRPISVIWVIALVAYLLFDIATACAELEPVGPFGLIVLGIQKFNKWLDSYE